MYLSTNNCFELDKIIKSFEVAYRSHITSKVYLKYPTESDFQRAINQINKAIKKTSIFSTVKYKQKILNIIRNIGKYYTAIEASHKAYINKTSNNIGVPFVSDLLDLVYFFHNDCFRNISNGFATIEEFYDYSSKYRLVRNGLSHPASSKILLRHTKEVLLLIKKLLNNIEDNKFWYISKIDLSQMISKFESNLNTISIKFHNLTDISFNHKKVICRESELAILNELIFGKDESYRKSGSVVIFGYGGVGKTALALEFLYNSIKKIADESYDMDFMLFYTSKDEMLDFSQTTGELYINEIRRQISSFEDFNKKLFEDLNIDTIEQLKQKIGFIVIDNIENLPSEKKAFFDFVKQVPRNIQFIFTSRNEEPCEDKLHLKEFKELQPGVKFIEEYIKTNDLSLSLSDEQKNEIITSSKGNTLIIVLTLLLLSTGNYFDQIIVDLNRVASKNNEIIADFMYKNTIEQAIISLEKEGYDPINILKTISLYQVPIDQYSISFLSNVDINSVEHICNFLSTKLILEKLGESFSLNEFANKYVFIKHFPDHIEKKDLLTKIKSYKKKLTSQLKNLEETKRKNAVLRELMEDWKPKNAIDKIAIAETFSLYGEAKAIVREQEYSRVRLLKQDFEKNEKMTSHPYIKFQKARTYQLLLRDIKKQKVKQDYISIISNSFEEAIEAIDFYYPYIKGTKSYGALLGLYGLFLSFQLEDQEKALRFLEDAKEVYDSLSLLDKTYCTIINYLSKVYVINYEKRNDKRYLEQFRKLFLFVKQNETDIKSTSFNVYRYYSNFRKYYN